MARAIYGGWSGLMPCAALACVACLGCVNGGGRAGASAHVYAFGCFGRNPGQFASPRAVAVGPGGEIAVADKTGRIQVFDPRGNVAAHWTMPQTDKGTPTGFSFAPDGSLWVADTHYHRIMKFSPTGALLDSFGTYGDGPGQFIYPTDVAVGAGGFIYVAEYGKNDRVQKFDAAHRFVAEWGGHGTEPGKLRRPMGLALDGVGHVYVADAVNHRIQKFTTDGRFVLAWGKYGKALGELKYPYDVDVDPDGRVVVCEYGNCRVQRFTPQGKPLDAFGRPGRALDELSSPWSLAAASDGRIFVADMLNHRILVIGPKALRKG